MSPATTCMSLFPRGSRRLRRSRRERAVAVQQVPTMAAARREQAFGAAQHDLEVGHRQERRSDSLDEIDLILPSPPLQDLPVGCLRNVLDGKMPPAMITHRMIVGRSRLSSLALSSSRARTMKA